MVEHDKLENIRIFRYACTCSENKKGNATKKSEFARKKAKVLTMQMEQDFNPRSFVG